MRIVKIHISDCSIEKKNKLSLDCWSNIRKYEKYKRIPIIIIIKKFTASIIYEINITTRDKVRKFDKLGD